MTGRCIDWAYVGIHILLCKFATEFNRHPELFDSEHCNDFEKRYFARVASGETTELDLTQTMLYLTQMLDKHHKVAPTTIVDEYDSPIQQGYTQFVLRRV